jgi:hypothetical protein
MKDSFSGSISRVIVGFGPNVVYCGAFFSSTLSLQSALSSLQAFNLTLPASFDAVTKHASFLSFPISSLQFAYSNDFSTLSGLQLVILPSVSISVGSFSLSAGFRYSLSVSSPFSTTGPQVQSLLLGTVSIASTPFVLFASYNGGNQTLFQLFPSGKSIVQAFLSTSGTALASAGNFPSLVSLSSVLGSFTNIPSLPSFPQGLFNSSILNARLSSLVVNDLSISFAYGSLQSLHFRVFDRASFTPFGFLELRSSLFDIRYEKVGGNFRVSAILEGFTSDLSKIRLPFNAPGDISFTPPAISVLSGHRPFSAVLDTARCVPEHLILYISCFDLHLKFSRFLICNL